MSKKTPQIVVIDYHKGNLSSVVRALIRVGAKAQISDNPREISKAAGLILPGVGSFYDAISFMSTSGQDQAILSAIESGVPFLGICLGQQLLFERGSEGVPGDIFAERMDEKDTCRRSTDVRPGTIFAEGGTLWVKGLGVLAGSCTRLQSSHLKVPHVGWDQVYITPAGLSCPLLSGLSQGANMYFTHSYALDEDVPQSCVAAHTFYTRSFPSLIAYKNVFGCQFHPEKSSAHGMKILRNFSDIVFGSLSSEI